MAATTPSRVGISIERHACSAGPVPTAAAVAVNSARASATEPADIAGMPAARDRSKSAATTGCNGGASGCDDTALKARKGQLLPQSNHRKSFCIAN
jgi:hypothetical protein